MPVYNRKDRYYKQAKSEGYKSRAAYKLIEFDNKYKLFKKGMNVLDCGGAPGGWSQVVLSKIADNGTVVAIDLDEIVGITNKNFKSIKGDFTSPDDINKVLQIASCYDIVISDIAPHTIGVRDADHYNSYILVKAVFEFTLTVLKSGGSFLCKLFEGEHRQELILQMKPYFKDIKIIKPDATRQGSVEIYILALNFIKIK